MERAEWVHFCGSKLGKAVAKKITDQDDSYVVLVTDSFETGTVEMEKENAKRNDISLSLEITWRQSGGRWDGTCVSN